jgi:hypothetical protein
MAIQIVTDKGSEAFNRALSRIGSSFDICIKTAACRIGLPAFAWRNTAGAASPDIVKLMSDPNVQKLEVLQYQKYCEKTDVQTPNGTISVNVLTHCNARSIDEALQVAARGACGNTPCDPTNILGGWPPAKGIIVQILEGVKTLLTTNPAILTCLSIQGINCPLISWLKKFLPAESIEALRLAWLNYGCGEFMKQFVNVIKQNSDGNVDLSNLVNQYICGAQQGKQPGSNQPISNPPGTPPPTTGRTATLQICINDVNCATVQVSELADGSWAFYDQNIAFIGRTTASVNFSTCTATIQNAYLLGTYSGQKIGQNECQFQISGYKVKLKLILNQQGGESPGNNGSLIPGLTNEQLLLYGGIALLALVGLILITRR